ncbi:hypothetical protein CLU79DRAFT_750995 [Phycomyces nitens]|nr:hypothetical protein CLU79DRAFT_750995 [Phycomyces nitens]
MSLSKPEEFPNIELHADYIKKVVKWTTNDLDRLQALLKARIAAEEAYVASLQKITKNIAVPIREPVPFFGDDPEFQRTSLQKATFKYEAFVGKTVELRNALIASMKYELETLARARAEQEPRKKEIKTLLEIGNKPYIDFRTKELPKLERAYSARCSDLATSKSQLEQQLKIHQQQMQLNSGDRNIDSLDTDSYSSTSRHSTDEASKKSFESAQEGDGPNTVAISAPDTHHRKKHSGFMASVMTQLANAAAAASATNAFIDTSKHNVKFAKLKKEIHDADQEYRGGIFRLETLRKSQMLKMESAKRGMENELRLKTEITRNVLHNVLTKEKETLEKETELTNTSLRIKDGINQEEDMKLFLSEYENHNFVTPLPVHYRNYSYGECKELLFGSSLQDYYETHQKTIPVVVSKCINAVEDLGGLKKEGIYRISGRQTSLEILKHKFEQDENVDLMDNSFDVFTIASVLKIYLRELAQPLFKFDLQARMDYSKIPDSVARINDLRRRISILTDPHRDTLYILTTHLAKVNENSNVNKMHIQNLSVIFTPAIFKDYNQAEVPGEWANDVVFEDLVYHYKEVFGYAPIETPEVPVPVAQHSSVQPTSYSHNHSDPRVTIPNQPNHERVLLSPMTDSPLHPEGDGQDQVKSPKRTLYKVPPLPPRQNAGHFGNSSNDILATEKALPELAVQKNILPSPQKALPRVYGHKASLSEVYSQKALPEAIGLAPVAQKERPKSIGDYSAPPPVYEFAAQPLPIIDPPVEVAQKKKRPSLGNIRNRYSRKDSGHHKLMPKNENLKSERQEDTQPPVPETVTPVQPPLHTPSIAINPTVASEPIQSSSHDDDKP